MPTLCAYIILTSPILKCEPNKSHKQVSLRCIFGLFFVILSISEESIKKQKKICLKRKSRIQILQNLTNNLSLRDFVKSRGNPESSFFVIASSCKTAWQKKELSLWLIVSQFQIASLHSQWRIILSLQSSLELWQSIESMVFLFLIFLIFIYGFFGFYKA